MQTDRHVNSTGMRLGYLVSQYPAVNHTFILREIRMLRERGFDVRVVSIRKPDRTPKDLSGEESCEYRETSFVLGSGAIRLISTQVRAVFTRPRRYLATLAFAMRLAGWDLRAVLLHLAYFAEAVVAGAYFTRSEICHAHTHFASTVMLLVSRLFPITFSMTIHGPEEFNDVEAFHMAAKVEAAHFVAAISRFAASQVMRASDPRYWEKILVRPLGVDPGAFTPRPVPDGLEILCVARLAPVKAHILLLGTIARLVAAGRNHVRLILVGEGPSRPAIEKEITRRRLQEYVALTGAINHDRVIDYYRRAAVFVLPSFAEGVPIVLMEAMAMEIPCVATFIAGIPELIRDGIDGLLVPPADEESLATALERLIDDPGLAVRLGRSARERVQERYSLAANVDALAADFRSVVARQAQIQR